MDFSLSSSLVGGSLLSADANAKAYIAAVTAAGVTVSATQKTAINNFYKTAKAAGYYTGLKRMYLPIWGVAAANAIDMIGLTSGTFVGTLTHSSGYVTSNGSTGHFLSDVAPGSAGCTLNGAGAFTLVTAASSLTLVNTNTYFGAQNADSGTRFRMSGGNADGARFSFFGPNSSAFSTVFTAGDQRGIHFLGRTSSSSRFVVLRQTSTLLSTNQSNTSGTLNSTVPMAWFANNLNGTIGSYVPNTVRIGAAGMTDGLSQAQAESFTVTLKTLWETSTGLTLP